MTFKRLAPAILPGRAPGAPATLDGITQRRSNVMTSAVHSPVDPSPVDSGRPSWRIGRIVAGSLTTGLVAAFLLVAAPFIPVRESAMTGAVLCGFTLGWTMLAVLSVRYTDQPQRWAAIPAVLMGACGLLLIGFGSPAQQLLNWVWPPAMLAVAISLIRRVRRQLPSGRWLLYPVLSTLALASIGGGYETVREAMDANAHPMPGQLVDVGGHRLHLHCTGSGSPTVVLETGGGEMSSHFGWIAPAVARDTRVCVYDRAGRGWSEPADTVQDGAQIATDLHTLLHRANVPGPYVLTGHSFGGLYVLTFAARYPDEVAGMVLIDSTAPNWNAQPAVAATSAGYSYDLLGRVSALISGTARLGLSRLVDLFFPNSLPPRSHEEARATSATANSARSMIDEYLYAGASAEQAASLRNFADKPMIVLTAGSGSNAAWTVAQNRLATLSTNSAHRTIAGATHQGLVEDRNNAAATSQAILDVVTSVRNVRPLVG
jgi:pimeloyl-ACP methyl ester carboxylesterase